MEASQIAVIILATVLVIDHVYMRLKFARRLGVVESLAHRHIPSKRAKRRGARAK